MDGARYLIGEIVAFVVGAAVLGLLFGLVAGYLAGRWRRRTARRAGEGLAPTVVRERILVRPDPELYAENEALRDKVAALEAQTVALRQRVARTQVAAPPVLEPPVVVEPPVAPVDPPVVVEPSVAPVVPPVVAHVPEVPRVAAYPAEVLPPEPAPRPGADPPAGSGPVPDDLTRLRGVGAVAAARLQALGYRRFEDVARLDSSGVEQLAATLGMPARRIRRQRWVERAAELAGDRAGEDARR